MLKFSDGEEFDLSGEYRAELRYDGWYVIGEGTMYAVNSEEDARRDIAKIKGIKPEDVNVIRKA